MEQHGHASEPGQAAGPNSTLTATADSLAPVLELDGFTWRFATPADGSLLDELAGCGANRTIFNLPGSPDEFAARVGGGGLRMAMLCVRDASAIGAAAFAARSHRDLNALLIGFFREPSTAVLPLAAYVRHLFWTLPLRRLHLQIPLVPGAADYVTLFKEAGFTQEGVVPDHALLAGRPCDVAVLGLLRTEFDAWCLTRQSRLVL